MNIETVKSKWADKEERYDLAYDLQPVIIHNGGEHDPEIHDSYSYSKNGAERAVAALNCPLSSF